MTQKIPARVLYVMVGGRWQPFHKGHLWLLRHACERYEKVIMGIVNPDPSNPPASPDEWPWFHPAVNPFDYWERLDMLQEMCEELGLLDQIASFVPWGHPLKSGWEEENYYLPPSNKRVLQFPLIRDVEYQRVPKLREVTNLDLVTEFPAEISLYSASKIRSAMYHDEPWEQYVPESIVAAIRRLNGVQRVKQLYSQYGYYNVPRKGP